jgi:hypothetical protein
VLPLIAGGGLKRKVAMASEASGLTMMGATLLSDLWEFSSICPSALYQQSSEKAK